jgi:hypothetical protein
VHPSFAVNPPGPTTAEPFAPGALYEIQVDTNGDAVADLNYSVQFSSDEDGTQTATVRPIHGARAAGLGEEAEEIVKDAPVSIGREALVTIAGDYRFSLAGAVILSFSTPMAFSTTCSSQGTISSPTRTFAAL